MAYGDIVASVVVNVPLMLTIAQASATFVAIIAGFFTTKIISISNDRKRILNKLAECNIQLQGRNDILSEYEGTIEEIYEKWGQEKISGFISEILEEPGLRLYTLDEIENINSELKTRAEEYRQNPFGPPMMRRHFLIPAHYNKDLFDKEVETRDRPIEPNLFGLLMFYVGITSTFSYIGLELWHSLYKKDRNI